MSRMKRRAENTRGIDWLASFRADGKTYDPEQDKVRLKGQWLNVWHVVSCKAYSGKMEWWTLREISDHTGHPEASVSARLRDFRKPRFGSHTVDRRRRKDGKGTWEYRLRVNGDDG